MSRKNAPTKRSKNQLTFRRESNDRCAGHSRALSVIARAVRKVAACRHECRVGYGHACSSGSDNAKFPFLATASRSFSHPITLVAILPFCRLPRCSVARLSSDDRRPVSPSPGFRGRTDGLAIDRRYYRSRRKEGGSDCAFDGHAAGGARGRRAQGKGIRCRHTRRHTN